MSQEGKCGCGSDHSKEKDSCCSSEGKKDPSKEKEGSCCGGKGSTKSGGCGCQ